MDHDDASRSLIHALSAQITLSLIKGPSSGVTACPSLFETGTSGTAALSGIPPSWATRDSYQSEYRLEPTRQ